MPKITVNDKGIYYEIHGEGYPLLMITGLAANIDWYTSEFINLFSEYFKLITLDNRGTGRSDKADGEFSIKDMADDAVAVMDSLNINRFHLMGTSMGGMIAQELILNYPEKVDKLVLCATMCGFRKGVPPNQRILELLRNRTEDIKPELLAKAALPILYTRDFIKSNREFIKMFTQLMLIVPTSQETFDLQIKAIGRFNSFRRLKNINSPTLVVHGKEDILLPPKNSEILAEAIPSAKLTLFDNAAHMVFQPEPEKVLSTIVDFLNS